MLMFNTESFLVWVIIGSAISAGVLLHLLRKQNTPRALDIAVAVTLLLLAALFLGILESILGVLATDTPKEKDVWVQYKVALYLLPFFTAGLATNILAHVVLSGRDYQGAATFAQVIAGIGRAAWVVISVMLVVPALWRYCRRGTWFDWQPIQKAVGASTEQTPVPSEDRRLDETGRTPNLGGIAALVASIAIPLVVAWVGAAYNKTIKDSENRVRYVQIAVEQLRAEPTPETAALRAWAADLLAEHSPVMLPAEARDQLLKHPLARVVELSAHGAAVASGSATLSVTRAKGSLE